MASTTLEMSLDPIDITEETVIKKPSDTFGFKTGNEPDGGDVGRIAQVKDMLGKVSSDNFEIFRSIEPRRKLRTKTQRPLKRTRESLQLHADVGDSSDDAQPMQRFKKCKSSIEILYKYKQKNGKNGFESDSSSGESDEAVMYAIKKEMSPVNIKRRKRRSYSLYPSNMFYNVDQGMETDDNSLDSEKSVEKVESVPVRGYGLEVSEVMEWIFRLLRWFSSEKEEEEEDDEEDDDEDEEEKAKAMQRDTKRLALTPTPPPPPPPTKRTIEKNPSKKRRTNFRLKRGDYRETEKNKCRDKRKKPRSSSTSILSSTTTDSDGKSNSDHKIKPILKKRPRPAPRRTDAVVSKAKRNRQVAVQTHFRNCSRVSSTSRLEMARFVRYLSRKLKEIKNVPNSCCY